MYFKTSKWTKKTTHILSGAHVLRDTLRLYTDSEKIDTYCFQKRMPTFENSAELNKLVFQKPNCFLFWFFAFSFSNHFDEELFI